MKKNTQSNNTVNEPQAMAYQKPIQQFTSFEDMNEAEAKVMANISGVNHLQNATSLIKKVYADELKKPMDKKINFD